MKLLTNYLEYFISPITGRLNSHSQLPSLVEDYVWEGDLVGQPKPSPVLIDMRLMTSQLKNQIDGIASSEFITRTPNKQYLPAGQSLSVLDTGLLKNTTETGVLTIAIPFVDYMPVYLPDNNIWLGKTVDGVENVPVAVSQILLSNLPPLEKGKLWTGSDSNIAEEITVLPLDNMANLASGKIWIGGTLGRPEESSYIPFDDQLTFIVKTASTSLPNAQALDVLEKGVMINTGGVISTSSSYVQTASTSTTTGNIAIWADAFGETIESSDTSIPDLQEMVDDAKTAAEESKTSAEESKGSAEEATGAAEEATGAASEATGAAGEATGAAGIATGAAGDAMFWAGEATGAAGVATFMAGSASSSSSDASDYADTAEAASNVAGQHSAAASQSATNAQTYYNNLLATGLNALPNHGDVNLQNYKIINLAPGVGATDGVNMSQLAGVIAGSVASVSGTAGRISIGGTLTDPIVDIASTYAGQSSITTLGTITTGVWNGSVLTGQFGGTGVNNVGKTISLGGNLATVGAFITTLNFSGVTNVTFPTSGTLATVSNSLQAANNLSDLMSVGTARNNLGLTNVAVQNVTQYSILAGGVSNAINSIAPGAAGQILRSTGASSYPSFTSALYPSTTTVNQLLYSSATNTIIGLATANNAVLITDSSGVPGLSSRLIDYGTSGSNLGSLFIGTQCGKGNLTSNPGNTGTGFQCLFNINLTSTAPFAGGNSGYGFYSLYNLTGGRFNVGNGYQAGYGIVLGIENTATGAFSLSTSPATDANTANGAYALNLLNAGSGKNTASGWKAGAALYNYTQCTFLGAESDANSSGLINATSVGCGAIVDESNCMKLGNASLAKIKTTAAWNGAVVGLAYGGTNANLTASANGLIYSTASAMAILATANNGVLVTSGAGIPSISTTLPSGLAATNLSLTTPALGTPSAGVLTNCTGLPAAAFTGILPLSKGGTNTSLTAANGGILYSTASGMAITDPTKIFLDATNGRLGIGTNAPNAKLQFGNFSQNRVISLYEVANDEHQFYGFGISAYTLRYQVPSFDSSHVFYAASSTSPSTSSIELMRLTGQGNLGLGPSTTFGGGSGVFSMNSASVVPTSGPSGGGILYVQLGALKYISSAGRVTTIALA